MKLSDQVALVTGAASGIGRHIAERFAWEGARVGVADRDSARAREVAAGIVAQGGIALALEMDVTDESQVDAGVATLVAEYGGVDVLVSNAGIQHIDPLVDLTLENWRRVVTVHLDGAFLTTRACMRSMISHGRGGSIVYTGSVHSVEASPLKAPYVAAKHALLGLARAVAKEGSAHRIRANVVCPGFVRTPLVEKQIPEQAANLQLTEEEVVKNVMLRQTVDGEFTTLDDVAEVVLFLAAFPTLALTGQSILVSHGWHMQ
ncbi:MAG: 3-hydroxybutyrate dehydrogenase [Isosphaeraceae bacterium]